MDGDNNNNDIFQKLNSMLEDKDTADNLKNILNNFSSSNESSNNSKKTQGSKNSSSSNKNPEIDINTILKLKKVMDSMNDDSEDAESNLLISLKPYLGETKKEKVDQYVKFLHLAKIIEVMNPMGGDSKKNE